jgi:hypothetical protein
MKTTESPYKFKLGYPAPGTAERAYAAADLRRESYDELDQ